MKMKNRVIFDFDDTIVDNSKLDYLGFKVPSQKLGINYPSKLKLNEHRKKGLTAKEIIKISLNDEKTIVDFLKHRKIFLKNKSSDYLKIKPFSNLVFQKLIKSNQELILCTVNNNPKMIKKFLKENNIKKYFVKIYTVNNLDILIENDNRSNRILLKTSLLRSIIKNSKEFNNLIYVGNSLEDYYSAKILKIKFIYFLNPYLPNPKIKNLNKVSTMKQLADTIIGRRK